MDCLLAPLGYEFMRLALLAGLFVDILCPLVRTFLLVQRMAFSAL
ncbi:MAG: hypothetical protein ACFBSF_11170 [Leptolyngbyaceae cyanobacterium]